MKNILGVLVITVVVPEAMRFLLQSILTNHSDYTAIDLLFYPPICLMTIGLLCMLWPDIKSDIDFLRYNGIFSILKYKLYYFYRLRLLRRNLSDWEKALNHNNPELAHWLQQDWRTLSLYQKKIF